MDERRPAAAGARVRASSARYVSVAQPERGTFTTFDAAAMIEIARAAMPGVPVQDAVWLQEYDGYYYDPRASLALPVLRVRYADEHGTWLYLDPERGGIVQRSVRVSRLRRWLYQGLHSLDFPFLYFRRPLWDIVAIRPEHRRDRAEHHDHASGLAPLSAARTRLPKHETVASSHPIQRRTSPFLPSVPWP